MSGLSAKFEAMSLSQRIEFVTSRTCSPEVRNVIMKLQAHVAKLERQIEQRRLDDAYKPYCGGLDD